MTTQLLERPAHTGGPGPHDEVHIVCECNTNLALCGKDMRHEPWVARGDEPATCVVCDDLEFRPCAACGR